MTPGYWSQPLLFLIDVAFGLATFVFLLRALIDYLRIGFNPIATAVWRLTEPLVGPLRRALPRPLGAAGAALLVLLALAMLHVALLGLVVGRPPGFAGLLGAALAEIVSLFLNVYFFAILIRVILSWVAPYAHSPVTALLAGLTEPLLAPLRRLLPDLGGLDFSPLAALVLIQLSKMILLPPLYALG